MNLFKDQMDFNNHLPEDLDFVVKLKLNGQRILENPKMMTLDHTLRSNGKKLLENNPALSSFLTSSVDHANVTWRNLKKNRRLDQRLSKSSNSLAISKIQELSSESSCDSSTESITAEIEGKSCIQFDQPEKNLIKSKHMSNSLGDINKTSQSANLDFFPKQIVNDNEEIAEISHKKAKSIYTINEIVNTEKDYVKDLGVIINGYQEIMKQNQLNDLKTPKALEGGKEKIVFGNIKEIYEWHKNTFCPKLIASSEKSNCYSEICELFIKYESKFKILYARFCKNKPKSEYIVIEFQSYFDTLRSRLNEKFNLSDYLIKPVQRITKYGLILKTLKEHLNKENKLSSCRNIDKAVKIMSSIPKNANDMMKVGRLEDYTGDLPDEILMHDIMFVSETEGKVSGMKIEKLRFEKRKAFLFLQKVIFSEMIGNEDAFISPRYIFKSEIKVNQFELLEFKAERRFILSLKDTKPQKHVLCVCEKPDHYKIWVYKIKALLKCQDEFLSSILNPQNSKK